jgi:hypothetical protein
MTKQTVELSTLDLRIILTALRKHEDEYIRRVRKSGDPLTEFQMSQISRTVSLVSIAFDSARADDE